MGMSDAQFKDLLRRDLDKLEHFKELLNSDKKEELEKAIDKEIKRVNASLQD